MKWNKLAALIFFFFDYQQENEKNAEIPVEGLKYFWFQDTPRFKFNSLVGTDQWGASPFSTPIFYTTYLTCIYIYKKYKLNNKKYIYNHSEMYASLSQFKHCNAQTAKSIKSRDFSSTTRLWDITDSCRLSKVFFTHMTYTHYNTT